MYATFSFLLTWVNFNADDCNYRWRQHNDTIMRSSVTQENVPILGVQNTKKCTKCWNFWRVPQKPLLGTTNSGLADWTTGVICCNFLVAKCNSVRSFVRRSVHPSRFSKNTNSSQFKKIQLNLSQFKKIREISQLLAGCRPCYATNACFGCCHHSFLSRISVIVKCQV